MSQINRQSQLSFSRTQCSVTQMYSNSHTLSTAYIPAKRCPVF